jgi:hypothetical protein
MRQIISAPSYESSLLRDTRLATVIHTTLLNGSVNEVVMFSNGWLNFFYAAHNETASTILNMTFSLTDPFINSLGLGRLNARKTAAENKNAEKHIQNSARRCPA